LLFFTNPYTGGNAWLVAGKGPDNDWDISFLFESPDVFTEKEIIPFIYDPTNGAKSSGDLIIRSSQIFSTSSESDPNFLIWGYNRGKGSLEERTKAYLKKKEPTSKENQ
jgi:hypothetical protein